jgi:hypothetical protein
MPGVIPPTGPDAGKPAGFRCNQIDASQAGSNAAIYAAGVATVYSVAQPFASIIRPYTSLVKQISEKRWANCFP